MVVIPLEGDHLNYIFWAGELAHHSQNKADATMLVARIVLFVWARIKKATVVAETAMYRSRDSSCCIYYLPLGCSVDSLSNQQPSPFKMALLRLKLRRFG